MTLRFLLGVTLFSQLQVFGQDLTSSTSHKKTVSTLVGEIEGYSVKRFAEVIAAAEEAESEDPQERLISLRARAAVAENELKSLKQQSTAAAQAQESSDGTEANKAVKPHHLKAAQAKADHYKQLVARLENKIVLQVRKERESEARKQENAPKKRRKK